MALDKTITLVLGDWSDDGHGKSETIVVGSNLDKDEVFKAYQKGSKKLGFNFIDKIAADYEDNWLSSDKLGKLMEHGITPEKFFSNDYDLKQAKEALENEDGVGLWTDSYAAIFLLIAKLGNETFEYEILPEDRSSRINIGGYGLFS